MDLEKDSINQALKIVRYFAFKKGTSECEDLKMNLLIELNRHVKTILSKKSVLIQRLIIENVINIIRDFLIDPKTVVRQNAIKFFRYLLDGYATFDLFKKKHIPFFIARSLERETKEKDSSKGVYIIHEILQSIKFLKQVIKVAPKAFPKMLANSLIAFAESADDQLKKFSLETIRDLSLAYPEICAWSGGIRLLIESVLDPAVSDISDSIIMTILFLINDPNYRNIIRLHLDLPKLFSIFTDVDLPLDSAKEKGGKSGAGGGMRFEAQLKLAKKAMITILKSWHGLIYLGNERTALRSMIMALKQPIKPIIRQAIYDVLGEILAIGAKQPGVGHDVFRVQNLLNYFLVMLIQLLLDCDLYKVLLELSGLEDQEIAGPANKLKKELTLLMHNLLPNCQNYANFLIASADQNDNMLVELKGWSGGIVNSMGNYLFDVYTDNKKKKISSPLIFNIENFFLSTDLGFPCHRINNETIGKIRYQMESEADDSKFNTLMKNSLVTVQKDNKKWNWPAILEIIETFLSNQQRFNEAIKNKFLKKVLSFFQASKMAFVNLDWKPENFIYAKTGYLLLKILLSSRDGRKLLFVAIEGFFVSKSFLSDLANLIKPETLADANNSLTNLLTPENFSLKMIREYVSWIGLFSSTKNGMELLDTFRIFESLREMVDKQGKRDHVLILVIYSLSYGKEGRSREFLQFCLENGSKNLIKACLDELRLLYRSELNDFSKWGIDLLVTKLYSEDDISQIALSVIEEITQDPDFMQIFLDRWPKLIDLGKNGTNFLITLLSIKQGFEYLTNVNDWTTNELEKWKKEENVEYVVKVEKCLMNALNFISNEDSNNSFRFPDFLNNSESSFVSIGLIQRMPWCMYINYESNEYAGVVQWPVSIEYFGQNNQFTLVAKSPYTQKSIYEGTWLNSESQFVLKMHVAIGRCNVDKDCKEVHEPFCTRCDFNDKKHLSAFVGGKYLIERNGVSFIFEHNAMEEKIRLECVKVVFKLGENRGSFQKMPPHIFGELVKTKKGEELLKKSKYLESFIADVRNIECPTLQKRAALWALGHIGRSKIGMSMIMQKKLIPDLVKMAEQHQYLSLRGTCIYILNMFANSAEGRAELEKHNWISHNKNNLGWICIPKNIHQFFFIKSTIVDHGKTYWPLQYEYWNKYDEVIRGINYNDDQIRLLEFFAMLSNHLIFREAKEEIKKKSKARPELFFDRFVFYNVIMMMSFYKFNFENRRYIYSMFEKLISSPNIFLFMDSNLCYNVDII